MADKWTPVLGEDVNRAAEAGMTAVKVNQILHEYENNCNKKVEDWKEFTVEDVERELGYCTDVFMLMKIGDTIRCDCGDREIPLTFGGTVTVYKGGTGSPAENDIPQQVKEHRRGCFGTCLLEEPSRHPGKNAVGGNPCEPYIVGASWLETYNNAKAGEMKTVLYDRSWLACRYMGRIMSADTVPEIDTTGMTEDEAFGWMLRWAKGEYIPQVLLDKITHIYAGGDGAVEAFRKEYPYSDAKEDPVHGEENRRKYAEFEFYSYTNINKFDSKFLAWSKFVNNLWTEEERSAHLEIRPVVLKAMSMKESSMGTLKLYNGTVNIMHSMTVGDGTFWHIANENPYLRTFVENNKDIAKKQEKNVLVFRYTEGKGEVTNGYVQFNPGDAFEESGERSFGGLGSADYFGRADIGDSGNPLFRESIKKVATNSSYPAEADNIGDFPPQTNSGEILMVDYNQQSIDMSLYAAGILLANKGTEESEAVQDYNGNNDKYGLEIEYRLKCLHSDYVEG